MNFSPQDLDLSALRRWPDAEAVNLHAVDATDRLLLDELAALCAPAEGALPGEAPLAGLTGDRVVVIGDHYGALALGAAARFGLTGLRVHQDPLSGERALARNAEEAGLAERVTSLDFGPELVRGARVVLVQMPRQLAALREIAALVAAHADPEVIVLAGGRIKHLSPAMNGVLEEHFGTVRASLARQKSRLLIASEPIAAAPEAGATPAAPAETGYHFAAARIEDLGLEVRASGITFAGAQLDIGTRYLLEFRELMAPGAGTAVDLGSGSGIVAAALAADRPGLRVIASDISAAAVASTRETARANGLADRVEVRRDLGLGGLADESVDLVLLNPPFHTGATVNTELAFELFAEAARVLRPGGELWCVYNSHLGYRPRLRRLVGATREAGRNQKFTVTRSVRGAESGPDAEPIR